ncbi:hypothetical protein ACFXNW_19280 [Nocardia sp. NPDC059180]|uniref:hypothetical protein n=1 Tax=Nocardia sp. NPDC059180 TaxID=3346761 RepID=UPI0036B8AEA1
MAELDVGTNIPIEQRMYDILARPGSGPQATLAALRELNLVPPADGFTMRTLEPADFSSVIAADDLDGVALAAPLVHLDPNTPFKMDGATGRSSVYSTDTSIATGGTATNPAYFRLPSFPESSPYLIIYFHGRQSGKQFTATLDLEVFSSGGSVRISATNNPLAVILSHAATGGARVRVPVNFTTTADGYGSLLIQRIGQTGFDWFGVDLQ